MTQRRLGHSKVCLAVIAPAMVGALLGANLPRSARASCADPSWELVRVSEQTDDTEAHLERWPERAALVDRGYWSRKNGWPDEERQLFSLKESPMVLDWVTADAP